MEDESQFEVKYDVLLQNKAIERTFDKTDIQKCLHQPTFLIDKKRYSLHQVTQMSNDYLVG